MCVCFPQADSEKVQDVGGVMVGFMRPGKHERIPSSASFLQNFKGRPGKNRLRSSQARNSPSTLVYFNCVSSPLLR